MQAQRKMRYHVKISARVSEGYIQYGMNMKMIMRNGIIYLLMGVIGGVGQQGVGGSPIIWMAILLIMLSAYKRTQGSAIVSDAIKNTYINNNSVVKHFQNTDTIHTMIQSMKESLHK